jgi:hypothetical protein
MRNFIRKWWVEAAAGSIAVLALSMGYSLTTNRQLAYAPCLAKVVTALRDDPAAVRLSKRSTEFGAPPPSSCDVADDVARDASRTIGELLVSDPKLYERLPDLLAEAGMHCTAGKISIACDCKAMGPFVIANPLEECRSFVDLPLPFKRALFVAVDKRKGAREGTKSSPGQYMVEVSYATSLIEAKKPTPSASAAPGSYAVIDGMYGW